MNVHSFVSFSIYSKVYSILCIKDLLSIYRCIMTVKLCNVYFVITLYITGCFCVGISDIKMRSPAVNYRML